MTLFFMACLANGPNLSRCSLVICILSSEKGLSRFNCTLFVLSRFVFLIGDFLSFILAEFLAFGGLMDTAARRPFLNIFNFFAPDPGQACSNKQHYDLAIACCTLKCLILIIGCWRGHKLKAVRGLGRPPEGFYVFIKQYCIGYNLLFH
jgi:hypothetical protein